MQVDRCFKPKGFGEVNEVQLHLFSDASRQWYTAFVYLRLKNYTNQVHCVTRKLDDFSVCLFRVYL